MRIFRTFASFSIGMGACRSMWTTQRPVEEQHPTHARQRSRREHPRLAFMLTSIVLLNVNICEENVVLSWWRSFRVWREPTPTGGLEFDVRRLWVQEQNDVHCFLRAQSSKIFAIESFTETNWHERWSNRAKPPHDHSIAICRYPRARSEEYMAIARAVFSRPHRFGLLNMCSSEILVGCDLYFERVCLQSLNQDSIE